MVSQSLACIRMKARRGSPGSTPAVSVRGLCKSFAGRQVVRAVDMDVYPGEVHALLGMNGSGKSTLVKMLTGNYTAEGGEIVVGDRRFRNIESPRRAVELGILVVHQEAPLVDTLSVAECMALFRRYPTGVAGRIRWGALNREIGELFDRLHIDVDPKLLAGELSAAQRGLVALAVALGEADVSSTNLLVLDEASAAIPEAEADPFLARVRELADEGMPVLMVTHRISEVEEIVDKVTIIRDGAVVHDGPAKELTRERTIALIAGEGTEAEEAVLHPTARGGTGTVVGGEVVLRVEDMRRGGEHGIEFSVASGEVLGIVGGPESGIGEVPQVLGGLGPGKGRMWVNGAEVSWPRSPKEALARGIAVVPRDRLRQGGVGSLSVRENVLLPSARRYWHHPRRAQEAVGTVIEDFDVRPPDPATLLRELSGGNQQKVVIGKWLNCSPEILVLDDPTQGVDPGARERIFEVIRERADEGLAVILLSTEPEQLVQRCDRVLALREGEVAAVLTGQEINHETVSRWAVT